jgi:predicted phosphodiesterase
MFILNTGHGKPVSHAIIRSITDTSADIIIRRTDTSDDYPTIILGSNTKNLFSKKVTKRTELITVSNLQPNSKYYYYFKTEKQETEKVYFYTSSSADTDFKISIYGDTTAGNPVADINHKKNIHTIQSLSSPDLILHTGDLVYNNTIPSWDSFFTLYTKAAAGTPLYPVTGNNDPELPAFTENFPLLNKSGYYSFEYKGVLFIALHIKGNNEEIHNAILSENNRQYSWLIKTLENSKHQKYRFKIIFFHTPVFPPDGDSHKALTTRLTKLFHTYRIDAVFNAGHYYSSSFYRNTWYFITGGGGAELSQPVTPQQNVHSYIVAFHHITCSIMSGLMKIEVISEMGSILDSISVFQKDPSQDEYIPQHDTYTNKNSSSRTRILLLTLFTVLCISGALFYILKKWRNK